MIRFILLIVLCSFHSCRTTKTPSVNPCDYLMKVSMKNSLDFLGMYNVSLDFRITDTSRIYFNYAEFCVTCTENIDLTTPAFLLKVRPVDMNIVGKSLTSSEFILENRNGEYRFYRGGPFFTDEFSDWFHDPYSFQKGKYIDSSSTHTSLIKQPVTFKINPHDEEVKLYYIYVPTKEDKERGLSSKVFCSDWIQLPPY